VALPLAAKLQLLSETDMSVTRSVELFPKKKQVFYFIVFFLRNSPSMFFVPDDVPREPDSLRTVLMHIKSETAERQELKTHF